MPKEDRVIIFDYEEVFTALRIHSITQKLEIPSDGTIQTLTFPPDNTQESVVYLELQKKDGSVETLDFTLDFFARALVFLCQGNNIPIPRAGTKKIIQKDNNILLHISLS